MKTAAVDLVAKLLELCPEIPADIDAEVLADAIAVAVIETIQMEMAPSSAESEIRDRLRADCAEAIRFLAGTSK